MKISNSQSIAAAAVNVSLDLRQLKTLTRPSMVKVGLVGAALGLRGMASVGSSLILAESALSGANRMPVDPDDMQKDVGMPMDMIEVLVSNPTGGAIVLNWSVEVMPIR